MEINGATAIITGGASGMGLATAQRLVQAGGKVVILDLPTSRGNEVAKELGEGAVFVPGDVVSEEDTARAVEAAEELGNLRFAIACAGIGSEHPLAGPDGPFPLQEFVRIVNINLVGTFNVLRLAAQAMLKNEPIGEERGVLINNGSIAAYDGAAGQSAYAASKGGVTSMTLPLARDLAKSRIRVMTIAPGIFQTPLLMGAGDALVEALLEQIPHPSRLGHPDEFAALAVHVLENPMLNGEVIRLDAAIRMG